MLFIHPGSEESMLRLSDSDSPPAKGDSKENDEGFHITGILPDPGCPGLSF